MRLTISLATLVPEIEVAIVRDIPMQMKRRGIGQNSASSWDSKIHFVDRQKSEQRKGGI